MLMYCAGLNGVETSMMEGFQVLLKIGGVHKKKSRSLSSKPEFKTTSFGNQYH